MRRLFKRFFWGTPSHKGIAWAGALSGLGLIAFTLFLLGMGLLQALEFAPGGPANKL